MIIDKRLFREKIISLTTGVKLEVVRLFYDFETDLGFGFETRRISTRGCKRRVYLESESKTVLFA